jgi:hypothetical protein
VYSVYRIRGSVWTLVLGGVSREIALRAAEIAEKQFPSYLVLIFKD